MPFLPSEVALALALAHRDDEHAARHAPSALVASVPREESSVAPALGYERSVDGHYLDVGVERQSCDGDESGVVRSYRIGIGIYVVLVHLVGCLRGVAHI